MLHEFTSLTFAWRAVKHVTSNGVVLAKGLSLVGFGTGQPSRQDAVDLACRKAGERAQGSVLASDGFFPFPDALERAASTDTQKVRDALATLDVSKGYAAMGPGGRVKFGPDGKNIYAHPVGVQWQKGDLVSVFPKEDAHAPLIKA